MFAPKVSIDNNPSIGLDNGLALNRQQSIIWINADPIYWRINAALGGDELTHSHPNGQCMGCILVSIK